jgi:hypothetical protein
VKAIKQATHRRKKDADDNRLFVEDNLTMGHKYALSLPIAVMKLMLCLMESGVPPQNGQTSPAKLYC